MNPTEYKEHSREALSLLEIEVDGELKLKQLNLDQADSLFALVDRDRDYLQKWLPWPNETRSASDSRDFIQLMLEKRRTGEEYGYGIEYNGTLVGHISLMHLKDGKDPEIGYWISSELAGKGLATSSTSALTAFALERLGLMRVVIRADCDNIGSNKVAEKVGYKYQSQTYEGDRPINVWSISN